MSAMLLQTVKIKQILGVGITAALTNLMQSLTVIVLNQFLLSYGSDRIAAMGIVLKINMIVQLVMTGFAFGAVPLFGRRNFRNECRSMGIRPLCNERRLCQNQYRQHTAQYQAWFCMG